MIATLRRSAYVLALCLTAAACGEAPPAAPASSDAAPAIVLVHGAFVDASSWDAVKAALEAKGRTVVAVNLPGRQSNPASPADVSLDLYRDTVLAAIDAAGAPVILVGHSFGGMTISNVAEAAPEKVAALAYVAAFLPQSGESLFALATGDADSQLGPALLIDEASGLASIPADKRAALFCNDCDEPTAAATPSAMVDEPLGPMATPVTLTAERFGAEPKHYIRTSLDLVVSPALQDRMTTATTVASVTRIESGHAPFLSQPAALADALDAVR